MNEGLKVEPTGWLVFFVAALLLTSCVAPSRIPAKIVDPLEAPSDESGASFTVFANELALSLEPSPLEDETTAAHLFVFNRGPRTWMIRIQFDTIDEDPSAHLQVRDAATLDRDLLKRADARPQCPHRYGKETIAVGPGSRTFITCVEALVDLRRVDEVELTASLRFEALDQSVITLHSPPFRVARHVSRPSGQPRRPANPGRATGVP